MLPNRCQFALASAENGVVKPFVGCDTVLGQTHFVKKFCPFTKILAPILSVYKH